MVKKTLGSMRLIQYTYDLYKCYILYTLYIEQGGREVSDFISFIKKNATNKPVVVEGEKEKKKKKKEKKEL